MTKILSPLILALAIGLSGCELVNPPAIVDIESQSLPFSASLIFSGPSSQEVKLPSPKATLAPGYYTLQLNPARITHKGLRYRGYLTVVQGAPLQNGLWKIEASDVDSSGGLVGAKQKLKVEYKLEQSTLRVYVQGLPPGVAGRVRYQGPDREGYIYATTTLVDLTPGQYLITAEAVWGGKVYNPSPLSQTLSLQDGQVAEAQVIYN